MTRSRPPVVILSAILLTPLAPPAAAQTALEFDRRIASELRARDAAAADLFEKANAARERGDHAAAIVLYGQVRVMQPSFTHATRRLCWALIATGKVAEGKALCREAVTADPSPLNQAAFAQSLLTTPDGSAPTDADKKTASRICEGLVRQQADDLAVQETCTPVAFATGAIASAVAGAANLERLAPDEPLSAYFAAIAHATQKEFLRADLDLGRARQRGLPDEEYYRVRRAFHGAWPVWLSAAVWSTFGVAGWLAIAAVLLVAGILLSRATLAESERIAATPGELAGRGSGRGFWLRRVYAAVLAVAGTVYYLSLPLVFVVVLLVGGGALYGMLLLGHIPVKIFLVLAVLVAVTCWSILKSLLVLARDREPGLKADLAEHPRLGGVLKDVAAAIRTRPIDSVYLLPGTQFAVTERVRMLQRLRGRTERCLLVGIGVLDGFRLGPFKAVLAHEYGHFVNRDTAGGGFSLSVRRSILSMAQSLARAGAATPLNPAWLFLMAFGRLFERISQGASRLQEVMADRWAVGAFGAQAFCDGLRHVIERSVRFDARMALALAELQDGASRPVNLYAFAPAHEPAEAEVHQIVDEALARPASPYDSHPSPAQRFEWALRLDGSAAAGTSEAEDAWALFRDRASIETTMTAHVFAQG